MFLLTKFLTNLIISPAFIVFVLLIGGVIIDRYNYQRWKKVFIITSILFYIISVRPSKELIVRILEPKSVPSMEKIESTQAYVLLGGGITETPLAGFIPTETAYPRITHTAILYKKSPKKIFITGGRVYDQTRPSESSVYRDTLVALGIPYEDILLEEESRNTYENALYTSRLLEELDIHSITLVTSATHMYRSEKVFTSTGLDVIRAPCGFLSSDSPYRVIDFIPSAYNLNFFLRAVWEYVGISFYQIKLFIVSLKI